MIIFRYILKNHAIPFIFANFILMAVFLLQFLMKFADKLVGKGLSAWVITKLIAYNLAWMVVLVVPMASLISTLMAFGNMSQNNEIAVLKASGVSLYKMLIPPLAASIVVSFLLIQFNNHIYPDANHQARILMQDISRKKPTLSLVPGVFSQDVQNYSILARSIDPVNNTLKDITIFDNSKPNVTTTVTAESGVIYFSDQLKKLIMELHNGEIHESNSSNKNVYRKLLFKDHKIAMNAEQFSFEQSGPGGQKGDRELGAEEMLLIVDSLNTIGERYKKDFTQKLDTYYFEDSSAVVSTSTRKSISRSGLILRAQDRIRANESTLKAAMSRIKFNKQEVNRYWVEIHKKYSLPVACVVFILLGAPLGTMTRKGGFGMAAGISLFFFLIYWAFLIGGEKLADRGLLSPFWGMWSANILLGLLGIWLTVKSAKERVTISFDFLTKIIPSKYRKLLFNNENS